MTVRNSEVKVVNVRNGTGSAALDVAAVSPDPSP